jgi:hypothetical protein
MEREHVRDLSVRELTAQLGEQLAIRLAAAREPGAVARRLAVRTLDVTARALGEVPGKLAGQRGARRPALAAIPVLSVAAPVIVAYRRGYLPPR